MNVSQWDFKRRYRFEPEIHDVAVFDAVVGAFQSPAAHVFGALLGTASWRLRAATRAPFQRARSNPASVVNEREFLALLRYPRGQRDAARAGGGGGGRWIAIPTCRKKDMSGCRTLLKKSVTVRKSSPSLSASFNRTAKVQPSLRESVRSIEALDDRTRKEILSQEPKYLSTMERQQIQSLAEAGRAELARIRQLVSEEQRHRPTEAGVDDSTRSRNAGHEGKQAVHEGKVFQGPWAIPQRVPHSPLRVRLLLTKDPPLLAPCRLGRGVASLRVFVRAGAAADRLTD